MSFPEDLSSVALLAGFSADGTPCLEVDPNPQTAAYWDAVVEVRRDWQAIRRQGPEPKGARLKQLNTLIAQAQKHATALGRDFTASDFM